MVLEYSTYVLEAKLVVGDMVFSIGSEFVENRNNEKFIIRKIKTYRKKNEQKYKTQKKSKKNLSYQKYKQDCEIKAFIRLVEKIKNQYPRLKILIAGDALYANKTVLDKCKEYDWKYIIRFKEGAIPTVYDEFKKIVKDNNESEKANYEFVTKIDYKDYKINIMRYKEMKDGKETEYMYMTDLPITNRNIEESIFVGRKRWKIENEGFNIQKNGTFDIGHLYSKNATAIKVHYLMIQIAHMIRQMLEKGQIQLKENIRTHKIKIKEISSKIKTLLTSTHISLVSKQKSQLRFDN